jgi:hypothetical protein
MGRGSSRRARVVRTARSLVLLALLVSGCGADHPSGAADAGRTSGPGTSATGTAAAAGPGQTATPGVPPTSAAAVGSTATAGTGSPAAPGTFAVSPSATSGVAPASSAPPMSSSSPGPIAVPPDIQPPLSDAMRDAPVTYSDGCHLGPRVVTPPPCVFGVASASTTVVLIGDSKAAQWFPALVMLAEQRGWRLISLTKSACTAADVPVWSGTLHRENTECADWRRAVIARVAAEHPALVIVSDDRLYELAVNGGPVPLASVPDLWNAGLQRTLTALRASAARVVLLGDTPRSRFDTPVCLAAHLADSGACATTRARAIDQGRLDADAAVASAAGARFIDPTPWVCPSDPCPPIMGTLLVYREQDHLTTAFVDSLAPRLVDALLAP